MGNVCHFPALVKSGINTLDHYLDDFIFAGKMGSQDCAILMSQFMMLTGEIGVNEKTAGPTTRLTFLGYEIDTMDMTVRIPEAKVNALLD